jgi:lysozyme
MKRHSPVLFLIAVGLVLSAGRSSGQTFLNGVDVSSFQGTIDWNQVAGAGNKFAIARVSDGLGSVDPDFASNYAGIQAAGLIRGSYQYFEPGQDPVAQADLLLAAIGPLGPGDLPPVLDVEVSGNKSPAVLVGDIQSWVTTVESATGEDPIIYTSGSFWNMAVGSPSFSSDPLWVANWNVVLPRNPAGWPFGDWLFWQYSDSGTVPGIGNVNLDHFNGTTTDLDAFAGETTPTVPDTSSVAGLVLLPLLGAVLYRDWCRHL